MNHVSSAPIAPNRVRQMPSSLTAPMTLHLNRQATFTTMSSLSLRLECRVDVDGQVDVPVPAHLQFIVVGSTVLAISSASCSININQYAHPAFYQQHQRPRFHDNDFLKRAIRYSGRSLRRVSLLHQGPFPQAHMHATMTTQQTLRRLGLEDPEQLVQQMKTRS